MFKPRKQSPAPAGATPVSSADRLAEASSDDQGVVLKERVREAAEQGRFHLNYQPILSLKSRRPVAVEALLRWDSEVGPVSPGRFVPILEELELIIPVGDWVLQHACRQSRQWLDYHLGLPLNIVV